MPDGKKYGEKREIVTWTSKELWPYINPVAKLRGLLLQDEDFRANTYNYNGRTYLVAYYERWCQATSHGIVLASKTCKAWWDYSTGILFKMEFIREHIVLEHTNANLTTPEMVPGYQRLLMQGYLKQYWTDIVVIVVLLSVVSVVLISVARHQERKKKNT
jgi:hypothetical protein